jgi:hypothetical protein
MARPPTQPVNCGRTTAAAHRLIIKHTDPAGMAAPARPYAGPISRTVPDPSGLVAQPWTYGAKDSTKGWALGLAARRAAVPPR